jgi:hypothetical protein
VVLFITDFVASLHSFNSFCRYFFQKLFFSLLEFCLTITLKWCPFATNSCRTLDQFHLHKKSPGVLCILLLTIWSQHGNDGPIILSQIWISLFWSWAHKDINTLLVLDASAQRVKWVLVCSTHLSSAHFLNEQPSSKICSLMLMSISAPVLLPWKKSGRIKHNNGGDLPIPVRKRGEIVISL